MKRNIPLPHAACRAATPAAADPRRARRLLAALGVPLAALMLPLPALAQEAADESSRGEVTVRLPESAAEQTFTINLRDTEITLFAEQVSQITERTLILDPQLSGEITVVAAKPLDRDGVWALFQSALRVRGFVAVQSGEIWQVIPEPQAKSSAPTGPLALSGAQDTVTRVLSLDRLAAPEAVRVLRPLIAESGYIEALADPNSIVVTDTAENVERIIEIARAFDTQEQQRAQVITFRYADAASVGQAIVQVLGETSGTRLSVDPGSNTLLARGSAEDIAEVRRIAGALDIAPRPARVVDIGTRVIRLQYADAEVLAEIARATLTGRGELTNPVAQSVETQADDGTVPLGGAPAPAPAGAQDVSIQASTEQNAIVVRGTARQIEEASALIASLDQRRAQVLIEAAIVEVSGEVADRLGVQFGFGDAAPPGGIAATSFSNAGVSLQSILLALGQSSANVLTGGLSLGVSQGGDFGALVQALSQSNKAKLLSTPSITTMDNQPATIVVGQNVPFRTGSFATDGNTVAPFTTIERRDVGITMNVLPRVTAGGVVRLEIEQEISSLVNANVEGAADLVTNTRVINTTVLADNHGTIVLGGLITDNELSSENKVPLLGDVPVVGNLFKSQTANGTRRTLFVFLRPTILLSPEDVRAASRAKLERLRGAETNIPGESLLGKRAVKRLPLEINGLY
ncbi:type II secretion system secretin GspD [Profundibacterium mesophilum]|uniref:Secretion protein XqhA n=1 Tax=Profundibacterium mesophilum KAUST100406-0324 TaxID=1037889 RepID=A0A921TD27_9RHOB|nr:type II secretion system secretin GspD [Profundibacterium mesophilum]KAF0675841.1 Secretion protein XqhA [Profundibacterium mesophilum KAUST100406-0324]